MPRILFRRGCADNSEQLRPPFADAIRRRLQYAIVIILAMGLGLFAPPLGIGYYSACAIARVPPDEAMMRIWPYLAVLLLALILIAAVPWFSTAALLR
jgi:TRAP-type C4-dicarboxylate transport system permease large subunit